MEERGCVSAVPRVCERATAVALNLSAPGLYRDYNQSTNHSNLLFPRTHLVRALARVRVRVRACVSACLHWHAARLPPDESIWPIRSSLTLCTLIASVQLLMDFITCNDTWPADLSQLCLLLVSTRVEGSRSGGSWGGRSTIQREGDRGGGHHTRKTKKTIFIKQLSFHFGVFILHNAFCNIFDRMVIGPNRV